MSFEELNEFICLNEASAEENFFNRERTLAIIDFYKKYKPKLGTFQIKNMKRLWEVIAKDISNLYKITISAAKCENKFKVLERNYKKVIDNNNKTGRGRKTFEFESEMNEIYGKKANMNPKILLSSNECIMPNTAVANTSTVIAENKENDPISSDVEGQVRAHPSEAIISILEVPRQYNTSTIQKRPRKKCPAYKKRNDILLEMKNDLTSYYDQKLKIEKEKLELQKQKAQSQEKKMNIFEEHIKELKRYNDISEKRFNPFV